MNLDIVKEACIEYCENMYALSINYLNKKHNLELVDLINELTMVEDDIRFCENIDILSSYRLLLDQLVKKIEGIINE